MNTDVRLRGEAPGTAGTTPLDHYVISSETSGEPAGIMVEEFVLAEDHSAVGLRGAVWTPAEGWWAAKGFSRAMRVDPKVRGRVTPVSRGQAAAVHRRLGGGDLPDAAALRREFGDTEPLGDSAPLRFDAPPPTSGYAERRVYRILFAKDLTEEGLTKLQSLWQMKLADRPSDSHARLIGTAELHVLDDRFTWDLRWIGPGVAWSVDLTAHLGGGSDDALGRLLSQLREAMRQQGLIPVTVERFA